MPRTNQKNTVGVAEVVGDAPGRQFDSKLRRCRGSDPVTPRGPPRPSGSVSLGVAIVVEDFFGQARREEGAYREYATDEQRRLGEKRPTAMVMNGATDPLGPVSFRRETRLKLS